jgi:glycosyltransferase involved in cell wall biosynthesis
MSIVKKISICVPAYNEESTIQPVVKNLLLTLRPYYMGVEIIIVDDGSNDKTSLYALSLSNQYSEIKVLRHRKNFGLGCCFVDAIRESSYDFFSWFPADGENRAEEFLQVLPYLKNNNIITTHHRGFDPRNMLRKNISKWYSFILNMRFGNSVNYYNGLTVFPTEVIKKVRLQSKGVCILAETVVKTIKLGHPLIELSAPLNRRSKGGSKIFHGFGVFRFLHEFICYILF